MKKSLMLRIIKRVNFRVFFILSLLLPKNKYFDYIWSLFWYFSQHFELPVGQRKFNSYVFHRKVSKLSLDPLISFVSDKYLVKFYIKAVVGDKYNVPTISVLTSPTEVDTYTFPNECVIKPTHMSGSVIIKKDGDSVNLDKVKSWFNQNFYFYGREVNYRYLVPKIIVEPIVFSNDNITDFKIFCYRGFPKIIQIDLDRYTNHKRLYFDSLWNRLPLTMSYEMYSGGFDRPSNLVSMLEIARALSRDFEFVRVDLYTDSSTIYVGELTHFPENGDGVFQPAGAESLFSSILFGDSI